MTLPRRPLSHGTCAAVVRTDETSAIDADGALGVARGRLDPPTPSTPVSVNVHSLRLSLLRSVSCGRRASTLVEPIVRSLDHYLDVVCSTPCMALTHQVSLS